MTEKATFYHAGCSVCVDAEKRFADAIDSRKYEVEVVHLGEAPERLAEAERAGVTSVPAFVIGGQPYHVNHGADLADLK